MRLIELEAAIKTACDAVEHYPSDWAVIEAAMRALPVAEERKHGHWIEHPTLFGTWVCSECSMTIYNFYKADKLYMYCPKCGATMDEVV